MRLFQLFEILVILMALYLGANLIRYFFFRESAGGNRVFSLSDYWINEDKKRGAK